MSKCSSYEIHKTSISHAPIEATGGYQLKSSNAMLTVKLPSDITHSLLKPNVRALAFRVMEPSRGRKCIAGEAINDLSECKCGKDSWATGWSGGVVE
jgi:hypothetical protein